MTFKNLREQYIDQVENGGLIHFEDAKKFFEKKLKEEVESSYLKYLLLFDVYLENN